MDRGKTNHLNLDLIALVFLVIVIPTFAAQVSVKTDNYGYSVNESVYSSVLVSDNGSALSNQSVSLSVANSAGTGVLSYSGTTNSTGEMNYTFSLATTDNYTITATSSSISVKHLIKVLSYSKILISLNKLSYTASSPAIVTANVINSNGNGVSSITIAPNLRYKNGTLASSLSSCTTDSVGKCSITFTVPSTEGEYMLEINDYEISVPILVGGFNAAMKISPGVAGRGDNVTIRATVKNANGNGVTASTRQLVITSPNGTQTTVTAMTQATDSSGSSLTGVYENTFMSNTEGSYSVVATITPQGSNVSKELRGGFDIRAYSMEISSWAGQLAFYPGSSISLGVKLKNATTGDNIAGKASSLTSGAKIYDSSDVDTGISPVITDQVSTDGKYKMEFTMPSSSQSGTYKVKMDINDSFGSGSGVGYFSIQTAKGVIVSFDDFPEASPVRNFVAGNKIVLRFSAENLSGTVPVSAVTSYSITSRSGEDATALFGTAATFTSGNYTYMNLTAPKNGGDYFVRAKITTSAGSVSAEGGISASSLALEVRPIALGGAGGPTPGSGGAGPGYFWFFRANDTVQLRVTVTTASEKQGNEGFMTEGSFGGGPSGVSGGLFGIGGGSTVQGAQVTLTKLMNMGTDEEWTSSATINNCVTDSTGSCIVSLTSNINGQNWTGGFYIAFFNVSTQDNKTGDGQGFFEVRKYFMDVRVAANTTMDATTMGFNNFNNWNVGPNMAINVSVTVREPGTWQSSAVQGTLDILGAYYGGNKGEFISPPKMIDNTGVRINITGSNSTIISAPSGGWKSGFYVVKLRVNISGTVDTGEGFFMSKVFDGFGKPVNPKTNSPDFTVGSAENVTLQLDVFNVVNYRPAANLTVSLNKILSFQSFPPSALSYGISVSQGTTDNSGRAIMTLPSPTGGWANGNYLAVFDVTNGTSTDQVEGFFMVKDFFAEISTASWSYGRNDQINLTATISSDPSWMRNSFGGGCPPGDTTCGGGGGPGGPGGPGGAPEAVFKEAIVTFGNGYDLDGDNWPDINIVARGSNTFEANISAMNFTITGVTKNSSIAFMGCVNNSFSPCAESEKVLKDYNSGGPFQTMKCQNPGFNPIRSNTGYRNRTNMTIEGAYNASNSAYFCVNSTAGQFYKVGMRGPGSFGGGSNNNWSIEYIQDMGESGGVGGSAGITVDSNSGMSYYNSTLKSLKVARFDFSTGETQLTGGVDYNVTSKDGTIVGVGNILIPGVGTFVLKPLSNGASGGSWTAGDYRIVAQFNNSLGTENAQWGFRVETFSVNCYRPTWSEVQSGATIAVACSITDPSNGRPYTGSTEVAIESVMNTATGSAVSPSLWSDTTNNAHKYNKTMNVTMTQILPTGQYQITLKVNESADVKRSYIWFEVRDFTPNVWTEKYSYGFSDNVTINAEGSLAGSGVTLNLSYGGSGPQVTIYRYDKNTWARTEVTGFSAKTANLTVFGRPRLNVNISNPAGWQEGIYEINANFTRTAPNGSATGSAVLSKSWFEVKLFDVWSWTNSWSNHPKNNVSVSVHVASAGSGAMYNGNVAIDIDKLDNTVTGATLVNGTNYRVTAIAANPATRGDIGINITPVTSLPIGSYRARFKVADTNGNVAYTEAWFEIKAFSISAYTQAFDVETGTNATINVIASGPSGEPITLTGAQLSSIMACSATCNLMNLSSVEYSFNQTTGKLNINTSNFTQAIDYVTFTANDTQNATVSASATFRIAPFAVSGSILNPNQFIASEPYRMPYQINETMHVNVTGSSGVNITNATLSYWSCDAQCTYYTADVILGNDTIGPSGSMQLNMTPRGINNTWFTGPYGWAFYGVKFTATKSGSVTYFYGSIGVEFPSAWGRFTGLSTITPGQNISSLARITVDADGYKNLTNATITLRRVYLAATGAEVNTSATNFTVSINMTNSTGQATINITPSGSFTWPNGQLWIEYFVTYGNATTTGGRGVTVSQQDMKINAKYVHNATNAAQIFVSDNTVAGFVRGNGTTGPGRYSEKFNISVVVANPGTPSNADIVVTLPIHTSNATALALNFTNLTYGNVVMQSGVPRQFNWMFNVTQSGNWTGMIYIYPKAAGLNVVSTTYKFESV